MTRKKISYQKNYYAVLFFVLFGLIFARYCYYGFSYYYQLDDYIQYHNYTAYNDDLWALIKSMGLLSARPLAGLFDIFIWSRFYDFMLVAVGIISAMYAVSAILFHKVFTKLFGTGYFFFLIYALLPLGFEGAYWLSASSRIIVGMLFASISFIFFDKWCIEDKKSSLVLFSVFQFISFCFYEQIVLLSGALTFILMLFYARKFSRTRTYWGLLMFLNAALYFGITRLAPAGINSERMALYFPWQSNYKAEIFVPLIKQIKDVFVSGNAATLGKGLIKGFKLLISDPNAIYVLVIIALCTAFFFISKKINRDNIRFFAEFFCGIFLAVAPLLLFFILKNPWFSVRNAVTSFCGLALVGDALFDLLFGRTKKGSLIQSALILAISLLLCVASVSEIHDYRETTLADTKITTETAEALNGSSFGGNENIWILNVDASYLKDANFYLHEHGYGVTSSDWAFTGAVRAVSGRGGLSIITPISVYRDFGSDKEEISKARTFFFTGEHVVPVNLESTSEGTWEIKNNAGKLLGNLICNDGNVTLKVRE